MHYCVHDWTLAALNKDVDIEHYWYAFDCVDASAVGVADSLGHISFSRLAGHAARLVKLRFLQNNIISGFAPDRLNKASRIARLLQDQIQLDEAEQMYMWALAGRETALGPDHPLTLHTVNSLGILYDKQSKLVEAEQMYMRALAGREKALGPDHPSTLHTVNSLGILYREQGKLEKAERMYMRAGDEK
ncbi:hypothetical protein N7474_002985 [Penicillium riverlandense]|uniref:uncharacterized protein n=1 Tax=Penicillium riverlandense TaxID=1903569 RepID=UPI002547370E|nr:uncharacterized protein N7474_002985 [Penicillium riverlandense]KAJ5825847.1 hypothetical protein N7474_002985 [Penicillium riverlandense]